MTPQPQHFVLTITTDHVHVKNGSYGYDAELVRVLRDAANRIERTGVDADDWRIIRDVNGDAIGTFVFRRAQ